LLLPMGLPDESVPFVFVLVLVLLAKAGLIHIRHSES